MKKIFVAMAATALVLGGCTKGEDVNPSNNEMATVRFAAAGNAGIELMTRTDNPNSYSGVIGVNPNADGSEWEVLPTDLGFQNATFPTDLLAVSGAALNSKGELEIKSTGTNEANFYSFAVAEGNVTVNGLTATIAAATGTNGSEPSNDYIYANTAQAVNGDATVAFTYSHIMSKLRIEVYEQAATEGTELTDGVTIDGFDGLGIVRNGSLNLTSGVITNGNTPLSEATINTEYFVVPQEVAAGKSFTVTYQGKTYTVALPSAITFTANKCRVIRLVVTGSGIKFSATLEAWGEDEYSDIPLQ